MDWSCQLTVSRSLLLDQPAADEHLSHLWSRRAMKANMAPLEHASIQWRELTPVPVEGLVEVLPPGAATVMVTGRVRPIPGGFSSF